MKEINRSQDYGLTDALLFVAVGAFALYATYNTEEPPPTPPPTPMTEIVNPYSGDITYAITDTAKLIVPTPDMLARPEDGMTKEGTIYFYRSITDTQIAGNGMKMQ